MTPRHNDTAPLSPIEALDFKLDKILLHVAGGLDGDGKEVKGMGEFQRELDARLKLVEEFVASAKRFVIGAVGVIVTTIAAAWAMLGAGPHTPPPGHP